MRGGERREEKEQTGRKEDERETKTNQQRYEVVTKEGERDSEERERGGVGDGE